MALRKPPALRPGSTLGLVAPAGYPPDPEAAGRGIRRLKSLGFGVQTGRFWGRKSGYLAGTDQERAADLMEMFTDPTVDGIVCLRGGYGSMRLIPYLDFQLISKNPKVFVGFSDITTLHLALTRLAGFVTFHGPMVASDFGGGATAYTVEYFRRAVTAPGVIGEIVRPNDGARVETINGGRAVGTLTGGNLTLVAASLGTSFEIQTKGSILFLEEMGEESYRVDRMLTQLKLAGKLDRVAGIVFGRSTGGATKGVGLREAVREILGPVGVPAVYGLALGHEADKVTLPLGVRAGLDADRGLLVVTEPAVEAV